MAENEEKNDLNIDGINEDLLGMFKSNLSTMTTPKVDTSAVDEQIKNLSTPASGSVYDKQAALYRMEGSGRVLETQKNIALALAPALELYKTRKAASDAEFQMRTENMPDYDDTNIFGEINGTTIPLSDEIKNVSNLLKEDYRLISNLNPNDPRYEEARKRIEQSEKIIVNYDAVNKKLFDIRNGRDRETGDAITQIPLDEWSDGMELYERQMWQDIYSGVGTNIKNIDGNLFWVDPKDSKNKIDLRYIGNSPTQINGVAVNAHVTHRGVVADYISKNGILDDYLYTANVEASLNNLRRLKPDQIKSLIFDGMDVESDDIYGGPDTKEFILKVIKDTYPDLDEKEIEKKIEEMKRISVVDATTYKDENGKLVSLKKLFLRYETNKTRNEIQDAIDKREEENKNNTTNGAPDPPPISVVNLNEKFIDDDNQNETTEVIVDNPKDKNSGFTIKTVTKSENEEDITKEVTFSDDKHIRIDFFDEAGITFGQQLIRPSDLYKAITQLEGGKDVEELIKVLNRDGYSRKEAKKTAKDILEQIDIVFDEVGYKSEFDLGTFKLTLDATDLAKYLEKLSAKITTDTYSDTSKKERRESDKSGTTPQDFMIITSDSFVAGKYYKLKSGKIAQWDGNTWEPSNYKVNKDGVAVKIPGK